MEKIKSKDLRIGNYVKSGDLIVCVDWINRHYIKGGATNENDGYLDTRIPTKLVQPIKLTKDWLIKFGFVKEECFYYKNGVAIEDDFTLEGFGDVELKYVHQLQNLYFALTGEELVVKDEPTLK